MPDLGLKFFRFFLALLLVLFFVGSLPLTPDKPAEAKTKKIVRKKVIRKKVVRKKIVHRKIARRKIARKPVSKKIVRSAVRPKPAAKKPRQAASDEDSQYQLPARSGSVTQRYSIEEGVGGDEADSMINGLESVGADDVSVDSSKNMVTVTYNTSRLTATGIVKKLKALGFSARRIF
jgi:hypothetical protein